MKLDSREIIRKELVPESKTICAQFCLDVKEGLLQGIHGSGQIS
jgi:hypothetical protein